MLIRYILSGYSSPIKVSGDWEEDRLRTTYTVIPRVLVVVPGTTTTASAVLVLVCTSVVGATVVLVTVFRIVR